MDGGCSINNFRQCSWGMQSSTFKLSCKHLSCYASSISSEPNLCAYVRPLSSPSTREPKPIQVIPLPPLQDMHGRPFRSPLLLPSMAAKELAAAGWLDSLELASSSTHSLNSVRPRMYYQLMALPAFPPGILYLTLNLTCLLLHA